MRVESKSKSAQRAKKLYLNKNTLKYETKSELVVITETKRLIEYILVITEKSPKKFRYSFINKIHSLLIEIIELLYEANSLDILNINRIEK